MTPIAPAVFQAFLASPVCCTRAEMCFASDSKMINKRCGLVTVVTDLKLPFDLPVYRSAGSAVAPYRPNSCKALHK